MKKRILCLIVAVVMCAVGLTACKVDGDGDSDTLELFINNGQNFDGASKDRIWTKIETDTGVKLSVTGAAHGSNYYTKLNPLMNTIHNMPDVVFVVPSAPELGASTFAEKWADESIGLIYNYDELLGNYPAGTYPYIENVLKSKQYKNIMHNGGHYLLPNITTANSWGIYYRTDWLINVGYFEVDGSGQPKTDTSGNKIAKIPQTMDEFTEVLRLFTENDPNKSGKNDTFGFCPARGEHSWNAIYHAFGMAPDWDINDGEIDYMYTNPKFKNFLAWAAEQYGNGYIYPTFTSITDGGDRDLFYSDKVGILITNAESHVSYIMNKMTTLGKGDKVQMGPAPVGTAAIGEEGSSGFSDWGGSWGGFCITKKCKNIAGALKFLDYMLSPEGAMVRNYGIKDVHYSLSDNGEIVPITDAREAEGGGKFEMFEIDGVTKAYGRYMFGTSFGYPVDWDEFNRGGEIQISLDAKMIDPQYERFIQDAFDLMVLKSSNLTNVTAYTQTTLSLMSQIEDRSKAFINNAIMRKKNLGNDWDALIAQCKDSKWPIMTGAMKEALTELNITE